MRPGGGKTVPSSTLLNHPAWATSGVYTCLYRLADVTTPPAPHAAPKLRTFYADDDLWHAAQTEAARRGETVSEAIRRSLRRYVRPKKDTA